MGIIPKSTAVFIALMLLFLFNFLRIFFRWQDTVRILIDNLLAISLEVNPLDIMQRISLSRLVILCSVMRVGLDHCRGYTIKGVLLFNFLQYYYFRILTLNLPLKYFFFRILI